MKFSELSNKDRYRIIRMGVQNGIHSVSDIEHIFDEGGDPILKDRKPKAEFYQRLLDPNRKTLKDWESDNITTHKMSYVTEGDKAIVYPEVQNINSKLVDFTRPPYDKWAGYESAVQRGDTIQMTPKEAEYWTQHYKEFYPNFNKYADGGHLYGGNSTLSQQLMPKKLTDYNQGDWSAIYDKQQAANNARLAAAQAEWDKMHDEVINNPDAYDPVDVYKYIGKRPEVVQDINRNERFENDAKVANAIGVATVATPYVAAYAPQVLTNQMVQPIAKSMMAGMGADAVSELATGKSVAEHTKDAIQFTTGLNPRNNAVSNFVVDTFGNPFYGFTGESAQMWGNFLNTVDNGLSAVSKNIVNKTKKNFTLQKRLDEALRNQDKVRDVLSEKNKDLAIQYNNEAREELLKAKKLDDVLDRVRGEFYATHKDVNRKPYSRKDVQRELVTLLEKGKIEDVESFLNKYGIIGKIEDTPINVQPNSPIGYSRNLVYNKEIENGGYNPLRSITTGKIEVPDFKTGKTKEFFIDPEILKIGNLENQTLRISKRYYNPNTSQYIPEDIYSKRIVERKQRDLVEAIHPELPKEYVDQIKDNISYLTNEVLPGSKAFGSSVNVSQGNLYHGTHDIDVYMTGNDLNKLNLKDLKPTSPWTMTYNDPKLGDIDINVIHENNGKAVGLRAHQLYAKTHPKEYRDLIQKHIENGSFDVNKIELPISSKKLLDEVDPVTASISDAFMSSKPKHTGRADYLLNYGNVNDVQKGFQQYADYLLGGEYIPSNVGVDQFMNPERNKEILKELGYANINESQFVNDPERMKLLYEFVYLNDGFVGRGIDSNVLTKENPFEKAIGYWREDTTGGTARGVGLNTVRGGDSGHGNIYTTIVPEKIGLEITEKDPIKALQIRRAFIGGTENLTEEQIKFIEKTAKDLDIDLRDFDNFSQMLARTSGEVGEKYKKLLKALDKQFNIDGIANGMYGDSKYVSLTSDQTSKNIRQIMLNGMDRPVSIEARNKNGYVKENHEDVTRLYAEDLNKIRNGRYNARSNKDEFEELFSSKIKLRDKFVGEANKLKQKGWTADWAARSRKIEHSEEFERLWRKIQRRRKNRKTLVVGSVGEAIALGMLWATKTGKFDKLRERKPRVRENKEQE